MTVHTGYVWPPAVVCEHNVWLVVHIPYIHKYHGHQKLSPILSKYMHSFQIGRSCNIFQTWRIIVLKNLLPSVFNPNTKIAWFATVLPVLAQ